MLPCQVMSVTLNSLLCKTNTKIIVFILFIISLLATPIFVLADCDKNGTTAIFINGIWGDENYAKADKDLLQQDYKYYSKNNNVTFINGYNESHGSGAVDIVESATQMYAGGYLDHDLTDILRQVYAELKTQKVILIGHSQGTFYANAAYDYLIDHGVDKNSIAVYNVATPADRVAGNGKYLTSSTDEVINAIVRSFAEKSFAKRPLPANIDIKIPNEKGVDYEGGHSFSQVYLGLAPDRVIGDINQEINTLTADSNKNECFKQPKPDALYSVFDQGYNFVDDVGKYSNYAATSPYTESQMASIVNSIFQKTYDLGKGFLSSAINIFNQGKLWAASISFSFMQDNGQNQQNIVVTAPVINIPKPQPVDVQSVVEPAETESVEDQLDDIQEKLDIIKQQINEIIAQQNPDIKIADDDKSKDTDDKTDEDKKDNQDNQQDNNTNKNKGNGGGYTNYPKILISEVQISPIAQRFIELYNPNSTDIYLGGWYLQRKDSNDSSWGSLVSSTSFAGGTITANSYLLISRQVVGSDMFSDITLSNDNSLALKNPNGEISDKLGFGNSIDPELQSTVNPVTGQSIGRKVLADGTEQDTDNNSADFEIGSPTPKLQNIKYVAPILSSDATVTSTIYTVSALTNGAGSITNIPIATSKAIFLSNLTFAVGAIEDTTSSTLGDPIVSGNTLVTTAQDGITEATYTIGVTNTVLPSITTYTISNPIISPNGDGINDTTSIDLAFSEDVKVDFDIIDSNGAKVKDVYNSANVKNPDAKIWDGKNNSGVIVSDGIYTIKIVITDSLQNSITDTSKTITVDAKSNIKFSSDATVTSTQYTVSALANGAGTIINIPVATSKATFLSNLTFATGAIEDTTSSTLGDPIVSGNTLVTTAQDGITKAVYTITANTTNWSPGITDSSNSAGNFVLHTADFVPNQTSLCEIHIEIFKGVYPTRNGILGFGGGPCSNAPFSYNINMAPYKTSGEYDIYISYCGGNNCPNNYPIGKFYRMNFDGTNWSTIPIDNTKLILNNNATLSSTNYYIVSPINATYTSGIFTSGTGTIKNVRVGTSKANFISAFTVTEGATLDFSNVSDLVSIGDKVVVVAQNGTTKTTYTITVDPVTWSQGVVTTDVLPAKFHFETSFLTDNQKLSCSSYFYQSLYPYESNLIGVGGFPCGGNFGFRPIYTLDMSPMHTVGDYTIWITDPLTNLGKYYEMHFDGTNWTAINQAPILSSDATITSTAYTVSVLTNGAGTITNIPFSTSKSIFENALTKNESHQVWDDSKISDPVATGDTLTITAQDGTTKAVYTITVNPAPATQLKIVSLPQTVSVGSPSAVFTVEAQNSSGISTKVLATTYVNLTSDSPTGLFSWSSANGPCDDDWTKTTLTIAKNTANKSFCYKDSAAGTYKITVSIGDNSLSSDFQTVIVNP